MSTVPSRLSVVTLAARDLKALRPFYRSLGWPELPASDEGWSAFLLGGVLLALYPLQDLAAEAAPNMPDPAGGWSGVTLACNVDSREAVDTAFAAAVTGGATVVAEPTESTGFLPAHIYVGPCLAESEPDSSSSWASCHHYAGENPPVIAVSGRSVPSADSPVA